LGAGPMRSLFRPSRQRPPAMTLEGVLGPNGRLDEIAGMSVDAPDAIVVTADERLLFSSGHHVMSLDAWGATPSIWASFDATVTALCHGQGGLVGVGLGGGRLSVHDLSGRPVHGWALPAGRVASIVDGVFLSDDELLLVDCGYTADTNLLAEASWDDTSRGQLVAIRSSGATRVVAAEMHCPMGVCLDADGRPLVSLLERAAIVDVEGTVRQSGYPGYVGRLRRIGAGYALACLSKRDPLIEFLKTEPAFIAEMKRTIAPKHWISPRIHPEFRHDFPIELGATRLFGTVKPWAPSFSYGLLLNMDASLMPTGSAQSRADGRRHAICDVAEWQGDLVAVSKASGEILNLGKMP
jgi:hypothetical protein